MYTWSAAVAFAVLAYSDVDGAIRGGHAEDAFAHRGSEAGQFLDVGQDVAQVADAVIATVRLRPRGQQFAAHRCRARVRGVPGEERRPCLEQILHTTMVHRPRR